MKLPNKVFPEFFGAGNRFPVLFFGEKFRKGVFWRKNRFWGVGYREAGKFLLSGWAIAHFIPKNSKF